MNPDVVSPRRCSDESVTAGMDASHRSACTAQRSLLSFIAEADRRELWRNDGARDMCHWLWMRYGISDWKARRWIDSARALERLPHISSAFAEGALGIDKVVELTRFASPESERGLLAWAQSASSGAIRRRAELEARRSLEEAEAGERLRSVSWWHEDDGRRFCLAATLPAAQGALVAKALDRLAERIPVMPDEHGAGSLDQRRADALVLLATSRVSSDSDTDRATVVVHAQLETLVSGQGGCEIEGGGVIHPETAKRLLCAARLQAVIEDQSGQPVRLGRIRRDPPPWMLRQLRHRDTGCRFPGCGSRRYAHSHHVTWWEKGGATDLENLVLVCGFHHRLVHEYGWRLRRERDGEVRWFRPDGRRYRAGPSPPPERRDLEPALSFSA
jgi:hypothetical protein